MGIWNNFKIFLGFDEDDSSELNGFAGSATIKNEVLESSKNKTKNNKLKTQKASLIEFQDSRNKKSTRSEALGPATEMVLCEPKGHDDSIILSGYIKEGKPVIVNLKYLDAEAGKRLIDFVCGTVYAFEGHMQKLGSNIFLFTPCNVGIVNKQHDEFEFNQERESRMHIKEDTVQEDMFYQTAIA